jgi:hypothetical protein
MQTPALARLLMMRVLIAVTMLVNSALSPVVVGQEEPPIPDGEDGVIAGEVSLPDTKAGRTTRMIIDVLNGAELGDPAEKFDADFLKQIAPNALKKTLASIRGEAFNGGKVRCVTVQEGGREDYLATVINGEGSPNHLSMLMMLDDKTFKIVGLLFSPAGGPGGGGEGPRFEPLGEWGAFEQSLDAFPGIKSYGVYELVPRDAKEPGRNLELMPMAGHDEHRALAIGSACKLYVLGALAEEVTAGRASWDEPLAIREEWKSLPSGRMQLEEAGKEFPIARYAELMISISDNTATDHLLRRVGRERVEAFTNALNDNTARNTPFLTTRELFVLKLHENPEDVLAYLNAGGPARREMLETGVFAGITPELTRAGGWDKPRHIDSLEWFASAKDCCRAMAKLREFEQFPGMQPLGKALRLNPGLALDRKRWKKVAFKGGSEPGVLNMTWLLERADGKWYAMSVGWNNPDQPLDEKPFYELCYQGLDLLSRDGVAPAAEEKAPAPAEKKK